MDDSRSRHVGMRLQLRQAVILIAFSIVLSLSRLESDPATALGHAEKRRGMKKKEAKDEVRDKA